MFSRFNDEAVFPTVLRGDTAVWLPSSLPMLNLSAGEGSGAVGWDLTAGWS